MLNDLMLFLSFDTAKVATFLELTKCLTDFNNMVKRY